MTIQQTLEIPADGTVNHLHLDLPLPENHPSGKVRVEVTITPEKGEYFFRNRFQKHFDDFFGSLKGSPVFEGDSAEIIRKIRDEW
ncbi:MAG: hypothetical protein LBQ67_03075 [Treponema sp.]|jgi:hypothetical protein|nr:hypothetical protein [Treponema sp.]